MTDFTIKVDANKGDVHFKFLTSGYVVHATLRVFVAGVLKFEWSSGTDSGPDFDDIAPSVTPADSKVQWTMFVFGPSADAKAVTFGIEVSQAGTKLGDARQVDDLATAKSMFVGGVIEVQR